MLHETSERGEWLGNGLPRQNADGAPLDPWRPPARVSALSDLLAGLNAAPADPAAAKLAEVRSVLDASDWTTDDRQYALEQIENIANGDDE